MNLGKLIAKRLTELYFVKFSLNSFAVLFVDVGNNHPVLETLANSFVRPCTYL